MRMTATLVQDIHFTVSVEFSLNASRFARSSKYVTGTPFQTLQTELRENQDSGRQNFSHRLVAGVSEATRPDKVRMVVPSVFSQIRVLVVNSIKGASVEGPLRL